MLMGKRVDASIFSNEVRGYIASTNKKYSDLPGIVLGSANWITGWFAGCFTLSLSSYPNTTPEAFKKGLEFYLEASKDWASVISDLENYRINLSARELSLSPLVDCTTELNGRLKEVLKNKGGFYDIR